MLMGCLHAVLLRSHTKSGPERRRAIKQIRNTPAFPDSEML
jgi:hypothetical protein